MGASGIIVDPVAGQENWKYKCILCDQADKLAYFLTEAPADEVFYLLAEWKVCNPHAQQIDQALTIREKALAERTAA